MNWDKFHKSPALLFVMLLTILIVCASPIFALAQATGETPLPPNPDLVPQILAGLIALLQALGSVPGWGQWCILAATILTVLSPFIGKLLTYFLSGKLKLKILGKLPALTTLKTLNTVSGKESVPPAALSRELELDTKAINDILDRAKPQN